MEEDVPLIQQILSCLKVSGTVLGEETQSLASGSFLPSGGNQTAL